MVSHYLMGYGKVIFMNFKSVSQIMLLAIACAVSASAVEYDRSRYDVILDRAPFGEDTTDAQETAAQSAKDAAEAAAAAKKLEKELRLCYLLKAESGEIRAGFQNLQPKPGDPVSVMLMVGESFRGMKLLQVDLENSLATLDANGKQVTFELKAGAAAAKKPETPATPQRRFGSGFRRQPQQPAKPKEPELTPEEQAAKREEVRENLRQYQMEVIRAGMPPLPIPLTPEMDDQLVQEGVFPPAE